MICGSCGEFTMNTVTDDVTGCQICSGCSSRLDKERYRGAREYLLNDLGRRFLLNADELLAAEQLLTKMETTEGKAGHVLYNILLQHYR